jgi:hypothetical protein
MVDGIGRRGKVEQVVGIVEQERDRIGTGRIVDWSTIVSQEVVV